MFTTLHTLFMTQYTELALAVDEVAERIRTLGAHAPGSYTAFAKLSKVKEENGHPDAKAMIKQLVADQASIIEAAKAVIKAAEKDGDQVSVDHGHTAGMGRAWGRTRGCCGEPFGMTGRIPR